MKVQRIQIEQEMARIQIESRRASLKVEQSERRSEIKSQPAQMNVNRQKGSISIDMTALEQNTARMDPAALQQSFASQATAAAWDGVQELSSDGVFVAQQPNYGQSMIGKLARQKLIANEMPSTGRSPVPPVPVEITGDAGEFSIDWEPQVVEINWSELQAPTFSLEPRPSVEVNLVQEPSVTSTVVEMTIPAEPGHNIDIEV